MCWFFDWIAGSCEVNLLKTGQNCSEADNANPGLTFSSIQMFFADCFVYMVIVKTQNKRPNNVQKTSPQSYKTQIKIPPFLG